MLSRRFLRIKVLKSLYGHFTVGSESLVESRNKMLFGINKSYELYFLLFGLVSEVADYAREQIEINRNKILATDAEKSPNMKFVDNTVIELIRQHPRISTFLQEKSLCWTDRKELLRQLYGSMSEKSYFIRYMQSEKQSFEQDKNLVIDFYRNEIEDNELLLDIVEDWSIYWNDEIEFIASKVINTLTKWTASRQEVLPLYADSEDERFVKDLFLHSVANYEKTIDLIGLYAKNWDLDRITLMDKLIIVMAVTEFVDFPTIPTRVTMDEYIVISKHYSTVNSNVFVNGMLDRMLSELTAEGKVIKTGRGLE